MVVYLESTSVGLLGRLVYGRVSVVARYCFYKQLLIGRF